MAEDDLLTPARAGDPDAWRALYRAHAGRLVAWLRTRPSGDTASTAEDLASEAWLVAASKIADFEGDNDAFAGWLFGIARNLQANVHRRSQRRRTDPVEDDPGVGVPDSTLLFVGQDWISHVLAQLPSRERDAVGLIDALGFDTASAAEVLGISSIAVRVARHRGLARLRRLTAPDVATTA